MYVYLLVILSTAFLVYYINSVQKKYNYWKQRGVRGPKPIPGIGNFGSMVMGKESVAQLMRRFYEEFPDESVVGLYRGNRPILLVRDPKLIKYMFVKHFATFQDRGVRQSVDNNRINDNLLVAEGEIWRLLRQKMTPIFSSGKIKNMIPMVKTCVDKFVQYVSLLAENNVDHELRSLTGKYTIEVIGSCVFGLSLNIFSDKEGEFGEISKKMFKPSTKTRIWQILDMLIPGIRRFFPQLSDTTSFIQDFFVALVNKIIREREGKPLVTKDFMALMIELKQRGKISAAKGDGMSEIEIDDELIAAQALLFYYAGYETSAATMSFLLHELAFNADIQDKIYEEVCTVYNKYDNSLNYEALSELTFLDMALDETLRKHTVIGVLLRKSLQKYTFPGTDITIEKGTRCFISAAGLHNDPKYYSCPNEFYPERFLPENKCLIPQCAYLPFGEGPRNCLGIRFAKVQSLMGMAAFLKNFKVEPSAKTKPQLVYSTRGLTLRTKGGIWLKISKRE